MRQTILDNDFGALWFYPEARIIHHEFKRFVHGAAFREIMGRSADEFVLHGCTKWLSDDRKNAPGLHPDDREWVEANWAPKVSAGWKYWALVPPERQAGYMYMMRVVKLIQDYGIEVEVFTDPGEAFAWLLSK